MFTLYKVFAHPLENHCHKLLIIHISVAINISFSNHLLNSKKIVLGIFPLPCTSVSSSDRISPMVCITSISSEDNHYLSVIIIYVTWGRDEPISFFIKNLECLSDFILNVRIFELSAKKGILAENFLSTLTLSSTRQIH